MAKVRRLAKARADVDEIWFTIALDSDRAAERVIKRIAEAEDRLADFPELGAPRPDISPHARHWPVGDYLILYRIASDAVEIVRIVHGARDLSDLFDEP